MVQKIKKNEGTETRRRVLLFLRDASDVPVTTEEGQQPEISINHVSFVSTTSTLVHIGNGVYYVQLSTAEVNVVGVAIVRYKGASAVECQMLVYVVDYDPYDIPDTIFESSLLAHQTAGSFARIVQEMAHHSYMSRALTKATAAVIAQGITSALATSGCIQYETISVSLTRNFTSPDFSFYILYHYDISGDVDAVRASSTTTWS